MPKSKSTFVAYPEKISLSTLKACNAMNWQPGAFYRGFTIDLCCIHAEVLSLQFFLGMAGNYPIIPSSLTSWKRQLKKKKKKYREVNKNNIEISNSSVCGDCSTFYFKEVQGIVQTIRNLSPFAIANRGWMGVDLLYCPKSGTHAHP